MTRAALAEDRNVLVDGSLRDAEWYTNYISTQHRHYPRIMIAIISVFAEEEIIYKRVAARELVTGRRVPRELIKESISGIAVALEKLAPLCNFVAMFKNEENQPPRLVQYSKKVSSNEEISAKQTMDREVCNLDYYRSDAWMDMFKAVFNAT